MLFVDEYQKRTFLKEDFRLFALVSMNKVFVFLIEWYGFTFPIYGTDVVNRCIVTDKESEDKNVHRIEIFEIKSNSAREKNFINKT